MTEKQKAALHTPTHNPWENIDLTEGILTDNLAKSIYPFQGYGNSSSKTPDDFKRLSKSPIKTLSQLL